jgi:hypothetical protein
MSTKNRVFSRLFEENKHAAQLRAVERRLEKIKKINLSSVQTLLDNVDGFIEAELDAVYFAYERADEILDKIYEFQQEISMEVDNMVVNGMITSLKDISETILEAIMDIEDKTNELGIEPDDIVDLPMEFGSVDELKGRALAASDTVYDIARDKYQEIRREMESGLADFW